MAGNVEMGLSGNMSEDENCTFISTNLLEQTANFDDWLDKNGVQYIITDDCLKDPLMSDELDPLLTPNDVLEGLSDTESSVGPFLYYGPVKEEVGPVKEEVGESYLHEQSEVKFTTLSCKCRYFEEKYLAGMNVEFSVENGKIKIVLRDVDCNVLPYSDLFILLRDVGSQTAVRKAKVTSFEKITLADDLDAVMPMLGLESTDRLFICPHLKCDEVYTRLTSARLHALVHIGHKPFKCTYQGCTWAFYTSFKLRRHLDSHTNQKDFTCPVTDCGRKFTNIYNLNIHIKKHSRPAVLTCPVKGCTQKFQTSRLRDKHFKSHDPSEAPFVCPQSTCTRAFFLLTGLSAHSRTHSHKETDLRCNYPNCGKIFELPCRLKEHSRMHTGQRPYTCTVDNCKWSFTSASKLKRHQSTHTKERKFHCTMGNCNKSFLRSEHLKEHTLTHIGQRSFQCEVCSSNFFGKSALYLHIKKAHPEKSQMCARAVPYTQSPEKPNAEVLLEQAIQSLGVPSDMILGTGLLPEEPLELLENENFSTVNLRDLD